MNTQRSRISNIAYSPLALASIGFAVLVAAYAAAFPATGYGMILYLPMGYAGIMTLSLMATRREPSLIFVGLTIVAFLRYVLLPLLITYNNGYVGRSWIPPVEGSLNLAAGLMVYELAAVMAVAVLMEKRVGSKPLPPLHLQQPLPLSVPIGLLILFGTLCLITPSAASMVSLVRPTILSDEHIASPYAVLWAMIFVVAKVALCIGLMHRCYLYNGRYQYLMPWLALGIAAINIIVFFGSGRIAILITTIVSLFFLFRYFHLRALVPSIVALGIFIFVFNTVTEERQYFRTSSTLTESVADEIQVYIGGIYNVAIGLETKALVPPSERLSVLAFDFVRPTVGLNIIAREWNVLYSNQYFNKRIFQHVDRRSQIIPMISQSYIFFGPIFSPVLSVLFVLVGYGAFSAARFQRSPEIAFCLMLVAVRSCYVFGQNTMNMMSFISIYIIIPFVLLAALALVSNKRVF